MEGDTRMNEQQLRAAGNRLFMLRNIHTGKLYAEGDNVAYSDKATAKLKRDELNESKQQGIGWVVTCGPDHWRYKS
jgi:hypothetical protein